MMEGLNKMNDLTDVEIQMLLKLLKKLVGNRTIERHEYCHELLQEWHISHVSEYACFKEIHNNFKCKLCGWIVPKVEYLCQK
jgi:hypothetical protein